MENITSVPFLRLRRLSWIYPDGKRSFSVLLNLTKLLCNGTYNAETIQIPEHTLNHILSLALTLKDRHAGRETG